MSSDNPMDPEIGGGISRMQMSGIMSKQPFSPRNQSTRWTKRYFVLKDGFLLYYTESEKREFDKKQFVDLHPKGILPLGGCSVDLAVEPGHQFCIKITSPEIKNDFVLSAETESERNKWIQALTQSTKITWKDAQLGESTIEQLEKEGLQMAKEKQEYIERLHLETEESSAYKARAEELSRLNEELTKENAKLEQLVETMKGDLEDLNRAMAATLKSMQSVEEAKASLQMTSLELQKNLEDLEMQKKEISEELHQQLMEAMQLTKEKQRLSHETSELNDRLAVVDARMVEVMAEKAAAEQSLKDQEMKALHLLEDKRDIEDRADQLEASIQELVVQKELAEAELQAEFDARMEAEKRLRDAEESLSRLESTITEQEEMIAKQMMCDVRTLRYFFENLAFEAKLDAQKCQMIKNSIQERRALIKRSKTTSWKAKSRKHLPNISQSVRADFELATSPKSSSAPEMETMLDGSSAQMPKPELRNSILLGLLHQTDRINEPILVDPNI